MTVFFVDKTLRQFINQVSDEHYPMTATVLAASAAQAAALGEACLQISLDYQVDSLDWHEVTTRIGQMAHFKETLLEWCNQEVYLPAALSPEAAGHESNLRGLVDYAYEVGQLSAQAAKILQEFRPLVHSQVAGDLEIAITLLAGMARTALFLLENHLQQPVETALAQEYESSCLKLREQIKLLAPLNRMESHG